MLGDLLHLRAIEAQIVVRVPLVNHAVLESMSDSLTEVDQRRRHFSRGPIELKEHKLFGRVTVTGVEHSSETVGP
eukprot:scaffold144821_cov142-Phaeocystis_antarctica.AAC.1